MLKINNHILYALIIAASFFSQPAHAEKKQNCYTFMDFVNDKFTIFSTECPHNLKREKKHSNWFSFHNVHYSDPCHCYVDGQEVDCKTFAPKNTFVQTSFTGNNQTHYVNRIAIGNGNKLGSIIQNNDGNIILLTNPIPGVVITSTNGENVLRSPSIIITTKNSQKSSRKQLESTNLKDIINLDQGKRMYELECDQVVDNTDTKLFVKKNNRIKYTSPDGKKLNSIGSNGKPLCKLIAIHFKETAE